MKIWEPGHIYALQSLDGGDYEPLRFVKRQGPGYPGNKGAHPGTIIQEVMRAIIDRLDYVNNQIPCEDNRKAREAAQAVIYWLERRAAQRHNRTLKASINKIETIRPCDRCGHIECEDH